MTDDNDRREEDVETLTLPAPTVWPMVLAFGVTLLFAGLVTNALVSAVGLVLVLVAAVGWWQQVLPVQQVEHVPLRPVAERAKPIVPSPTTVDRRQPGEGRHRTRIPVEVPPLSAGVKGGILGGVVMAVVALAYGVIFQRSLWYPINLLAAVAMPGLAHASLAELRAFNATAVAIGIVAHGLLSILTGLLYAVILPMLPSRHVFWGGLVAPLLWTGGLWAVLGLVNPVMNARVDWPWFVVSQIAFGLAAGYVVQKAQPVATVQTWPRGARPASKARAA